MAIVVQVVNINDDKGVPDVEIEISIKGKGSHRTKTNSSGKAFFPLQKGDGSLYVKPAQSYLIKNDTIEEAVTILYKSGGFWGSANYWIP